MIFKGKTFLFVCIFCLLSLTVISASGTSEVSEDGKTTITVWTQWTDTDDTNSVAFRAALESAKTELPGIEIIHDATENEAYKTKIKTAISADEAPDVFFSWGAGFLKPFVDGGKVIPLDEYLKDGTLDKMNMGANTNFTFDGEIYGLTFTKWVGSLYCNKEIFDAYNVKLPETFDELLTAVKIFRENNVTPFTVGEKDKWPGMFLQNILAVRTAGAETSNLALNKNASFDTEDFVASAALLKELVDAGAFVDGALGLTYDEGNALFLEGQAAMYFMGDWFAGQIAGSSIVNEVVAMKFPSIENQKGDQTQFLGGSIDGLCVSSNSENLESSATVVKYLMEQTSRNLAKAGVGIPTWEVDGIQSESSNPIVLQIKELVKGSTGYVLAWDTFLSGAAADDHKNYVQQLFGGTLTPSDFASKMQALNEE